MSDHKPAIAQAERRLHQRHSVQVPIRIQPEDEPTAIAAATTNLGLYGCSVMLTDQLPVGQRVRIELSLADQPAFVRGRVITRHPQFGNGIMFLKFEDDAEDRLRSFLEALNQ